MAQEFKAVLFDMDGLMADTERLYIRANEILAGEYGKQVTDAITAQMMGRSTVESLRIFGECLGIQTPAEELAQKRSQLMLDLIETDLVAMPGLPEILAYLRPRYRLGLATGSVGAIMTRILTSLKLSDFFDVTQSCDGLRYGKPDPAIYLQTCRRLAVDAEQCIVLEDSANGVRAGVAAGCYVIAVPNEHTISQDLSLAAVRVKNLHEAMEHIRALTADAAMISG